MMESSSEVGPMVLGLKGTEPTASCGQCGWPDVNLLVTAPVVDFRGAH